MHMPGKNPELWALVLDWFSLNYPTIYAACATSLMVTARVIYGGGSWRQVLLEATICMLLTTSLIEVLEHFGLSQGLATPAGVWIGFLGVKKIADLADRFANLKFPGPGPE